MTLQEPLLSPYGAKALSSERDEGKVWGEGLKLGKNGKEMFITVLGLSIVELVTDWTNVSAVSAERIIRLTDSIDDKIDGD